MAIKLKSYIQKIATLASLEQYIIDSNVYMSLSINTKSILHDYKHHEFDSESPEKIREILEATDKITSFNFTLRFEDIKRVEGEWRENFPSDWFNCKYEFFGSSNKQPIMLFYFTGTNIGTSGPPILKKTLKFERIEIDIENFNEAQRYYRQVNKNIADLKRNFEVCELS